MKEKLIKFIKDRHNQKKYFSWLVCQVRPYKRKILFVTGMQCMIALLGVSTASVNKLIVDRASASLGMAGSIAIAIAISALSLILSAVVSMYMSVLNERFSFQTKIVVYKDIMKSSWCAIQKYHSEDLLTRLTSDVNAVTNGIVSVFVSVFTLMIRLVAAFFLLYHYNWRLAVFIVVLSPVAVIVSLWFGAYYRKFQVKFQETESKYRVYLQEQISHLTVVKAFSYEKQGEENLLRLQDERIKLLKKKNRLSILANLILGITFSGGYLFAFISGAMQIAQGAITYGTLTAFLSLVGQIQSPVLGLAQTMPQIVSILASAGRIMEITGLEKEKEEEQETGGGLLTVGEAIGIKGENVSFTYEEEKRILDDFCMNVEPGTMVGIMGHSGVGKTTLIRIIMGFLSPEAGSVTFYNTSGHNVETSVHTRKYISYVPQGNTLFSGTIAENLLVGNPEATPEMMKEALEAACAWEFVKELPMGLDTLLGEKAAGISEGQAQRISIARAFIRNAPLLVLDEATSALDEDTEMKILHYLKKKKNRPTCFVITHRSVVKNYADKIIRMG